MSRSHSLLSRSWLVAAFLLAACAQQQSTVDRVQPNYFDKSFFVGKDYLNVADDPEFYSQGTLVDVGYGAGQDGLFTSTYAQPLTRVKWTVNEDLLIARLAYERVANSDGKGAGKATNDGTVVAAYKIQSHFDIKHDYNPSTGEQTNVIGENTIDRPWFERQFIRVDWSKNLSTDNYDYDTLSQMGVYGGIKYEPLSYYINDPTHPDAPHMDTAGGYLDITNKAFASPQMIDLSMFGAGEMPACFFDADFAGGEAPSTGCSPVELTIRQSFRKVPETDYEPADWDGYRFQAFGAFTSDRFGYARNYGMTDTQWHRFINRYNIWDRSHFYADPAGMTGEVACFTPQTTPTGADAHRDENGDGTEDECAAAGSGSRCDTFKQKCTLPYRNRDVKPLAWYYASGGNSEFFEASRRATNEWDVALRSAVITAKYSECVRTKNSDCAAQYPVYTGQQDDNGDAIALASEVDDCRAGRSFQGQDCNAVADQIGAQRGYTAGVIALAKMPEMIVLCHSPVETNDPATCGTPRLPADVTAADCEVAAAANDTDKIKVCNAALTVRRGDLRYHQINGITTPQTPSPWGIMVDSNDPLTGEVVTASINVWTHVNDLWSQSVVDMARYIKGELTTADVTDGTYVRDWATAAEAATRSGSLLHMGDEQRNSMMADMLHTNVTDLAISRAAFKGSAIEKQAKALLHEMRDVRADATAPSSTRQVYEARRKRALNTPTEAAITTKMMQQLGGGLGKVDPALMTELSSPLRGANPTVQRDIRNAKEIALGNRAACVMNEAPAPLGIANLADVLETKFGKFDKNQDKGQQLARAERMRNWLARTAHYSVIVHEMGHSVGLRHNFVSSADAFNYRPQYWQLRTDNGTNTTACTNVDGTGSCVGSRSMDPVNDNERNNLISMFMQSTTMDYAGETTQDMVGIGAYDFAAARMFYGDVAAVIAGPDGKAQSKLGLSALDKMDNFGGILGIRFVVGASTTRDPTATTDIHYSQLQKELGMISDCKPVDVNNFKPANWNDDKDGSWSPLLDGLIVSVNNQATRCRQRAVDYRQWNDLTTLGDTQGGNGRSGSNVSKDGQVRWPYGFATDTWADLGNLSVYRHDNGADAYELFDFLITQQEVNHIFDNYRRNRQTFSVRNAANRTLTRYNEKLRDAAKGLGLMANVYRDFAQAQGYDYDGLWPVIGSEFFADNLLASGIGFDHFAREMARPAAGPHMMGSQGATRVLRSNLDNAGNAGTVALTIPNGATGYYGDVSPGGKPLENALSDVKGEYDSEYTINAGSYYEKAYTAMLMTESVDNFISSSRRDFLDARYRAVSVADVFPDGYRRWLANNLTGDDVIKGARVASNAAGAPMRDAAGFPASGMGFTSWWRTTPQVCFQNAVTITCDAAPANTVAIDPQIGWEQQKFLIAYTLMYLPENQQQTWLNQLNIWELGADSDPGFTNRIELHLPDGRTFIAKTFGKETVLGKTVQKGIGARMLEWGNQLLSQAYVTTAGPDLDGDGSPDWYVPTILNGAPQVKYDPTISWITPAGNVATGGRPGCDATDSSTCTCSSNNSCLDLTKYEEVPFFMRQAMRDYGLADPSMRGIY